MTTALIICGALAHEVIEIVNKHGWDAEVFGVPALDHMFPEKIAPDVEKRILELKDQYERLIVVYGDCGTRGALDEMLARHHIERIDGPHCYEMYGGKTFEELMKEEPGTYFLTDFLIRVFEGAVIKEMGLDRYPDLKPEYFRNYRRLVYLAQSDNPKLRQKAKEIAEYMEFPLEIRYTGYGLLEERLIEKMEGE